MSVIEKFSAISSTINKLFDFVTLNEEISKDFENYLNFAQINVKSEKDITKELLPYICEASIDKISIIDKFLEQNPKLDKFEKNTANSLKDSYFSMFKVKRVLKSGFEVESLVNEKNYSLIVLAKMTDLRGIGVCDYIHGRIFKLDNEYYLIDIRDIYGSSDHNYAMRLAISDEINCPSKAWWDNEKKYKQIEESIPVLGQKFKDTFSSEVVISDNKTADTLISLYSDYCESGEVPDKKAVQELIKEPSKWGFYRIKEFERTESDFLEKASEGFSSHCEQYDVGIYFDNELGLFVIPFYGSFMKIFEGVEVENKDACIEHFIKSDRVPPSVLRLAASKYENFNSVIEDFFKKPYTVEELIKEFKQDFVCSKNFSSTSVLYHSKVFSKAMGYLENKAMSENIDYSNAQRNEPCPCGSGLKYKKCCMEKFCDII